MTIKRKKRKPKDLPSLDRISYMSPKKERKSKKKNTKKKKSTTEEKILEDLFEKSRQITY
ncbi:MAG: hypothetical protein QXW70_04150 [Candidatus Anstonellales archaeon]